MPIKVLCLGDVVGKPGRLAVAELLPGVIKERGIDLVVANAENAAGGSGLTPPIYEKILRTGVDVCTLGDHAFRKREVHTILEQPTPTPKLIRPANFPPPAVGRGWTIATSRSGVKVAVLNVMGRLHMSPQMDDPFRAVDALLAQVPPEVKVRILDFHAEVSSEKIAMGWHIAGRVSICYGTHTHVPTADARIIPGDALSGGTGGATAYVSDLGMCGPYESILGRRKDRVLKFMTTGLPHFFEVATGDPRIAGIIATVDEVSGNGLAIERLDMKATEQAGAYDADDGKGQGGGDVG